MIPSYETLDLIADAYNPTLLLCAIACGLYTTIRTGGSRKLLNGLGQASDLIILLVLVYGMLILDNAIGIWAQWGLDYSTHTAFAAAMCFALWQCSERAAKPALRWVWPLSLVVYLGLMHYQQYHTWGDMLVTLMYIGAAIMIIRNLPGTVLRKV